MPLLSLRLLGVSFTVVILGTVAALLSARAPERQSKPLLIDAPAAKSPAVGDKVATGLGERRRVVLPGKTVVYLHERSALTVKGDEHVGLTAGEAFFEAAGSIMVSAPNRQVTGRDSRFAVRVSDDGDSVLVASGRASVGGVGAVRAGQHLAATAKVPAAAQRVSHLLAWTRDLRPAPRLVPASEHAGGTLIARDSDGQETKLELRKFHLDVHIEDGFARTTIDQTYFNHADERLEGTFRFPLPPDASLSRLAMYVDGQLMEGGMVERDEARAIYERILYERRDPALLEWVDGSTFKMRVFPLEGRQEKRLLLSYTQKLPSLYGELGYRFPAGHSLARVGEWSLQARAKDGAAMKWRCDSHALKATKDKGDLVLSATRKDAPLDRDVVLSFSPPSPPGGRGAGGEGGKDAGGEGDVRFSSAELDGQKYLMVRYRPTLAGAAAAERRDWVVLVETSADRDPLLMRTQVEALRSLLDYAGRDDTFTVVTAATRARKLHAKPVANTPEAAAAALGELEKAHRIGALDLGKALDAVRPMLEAGTAPHLLHLGSGIAAMGPAKTDELVKKLPKGARYVGVGVGKRWDRAFMQAAAEATGGYFTQVNPDEPVAWRGIDLLMTLNTPRLMDVSVHDKGGKQMFLPFVRLVSQGEEIAAVARITGDMPEAVLVKGRLDGKEVVTELAVKDVQEKAGYLPRSWARLEIDRLLAQDARENKKAIIALSKDMYVMTPYTSLLVLENEDMYKQFKVDRGRKDHWAMYPAPAKIKVVKEPIDGDQGDPKKGLKPTADTVRQTVIVRHSAEALALKARKRVELEAWYESASRTSRMARGAVSREELAQLGSLTLKSLNDAEGVDTRTMGEVVGLGNASRKRAPFSRDQSRIVPTTGQPINPLDDEAPGEKKESRPQSDTMGGTASGTGDVDKKKRIVELNEVLDKLPGTEREQLKRDLKHLGALPAGLSAWDHKGGEVSGSSALYYRPRFSGNDEVYSNLLSYAPGLNNTYADIEAVVAAEARLTRATRSGTVASGVRELFDKARGTGWRSLSIPATKFAPAYTVTFDHTGRYAWDRTLSSGLKERVVCDGKTLWHLYPELRLAAKRTVSGPHRLDLSRLVPIALPKPEDLTRGADVELLTPSVVAVIPHVQTDPSGRSRPRVHTHFIFRDGRLAERVWFAMPSRIVLARETYAPGKVADAKQPALTADVKKLLVLDLPIRSNYHIVATDNLSNIATRDYPFAAATKLVASFAAQGNGNAARSTFLEALANKDQRHIGYYVLLASAGVNLDSSGVDVLDAHPDDPLAQYLGLYSSPVLRRSASQWATGSNTWKDGLLHRLALGHALTQRWSSRRPTEDATRHKAERARALAYVKQYAGTELAWGLLGLVQDRSAELTVGAEAKAAYRDLATAYGQFTDVPGLAEYARYEQARCLWKSEQGDAARKQFTTLLDRARERGGVLPVDSDLHAALRAGKGDGAWAAVMRREAQARVKADQRGQALLLAWQSWQLDDQPTSRALFAEAMKGVKVNDLPTQYAGLTFLLETHQRVEAEAFVNALLKDADNAKHSGLWRVASRLAEVQFKHARRLECLETALDLEEASPSAFVRVDRLRADYGALLREYESLAKSLVTLKLAPPAGFRDKIVRAADHWRAVTPHDADATSYAASALRTLGERELAWDYMTTRVAFRPGESEVWVGMANELRVTGERDLADRAYEAAFEREGSNAQVLWDRAENLRQAGRAAAARKLYKQLAEGAWQPRFEAVKQRAKWAVEGKE